ncbi:MAG: hypothetical protein WCE93_03040, partial [Nitrososphaeraceae archaeon]
DIHVDNLIREQYLDPFGISLSQAETAARHHDYKKVMRIKDGPTIILFLKKMKGHYLLTKGTWNAPVYDIEDVFKIYDDFIGSQEDINPLQIMQKIAEHFGYDLIFGKRVAKYIIEERIRIPKVSNPNEFMNNLIGNYIKIPEMISMSSPQEYVSTRTLTDTKAMLEQGIDNDFLNIPFLYALDAAKYKDHLDRSQ